MVEQVNACIIVPTYNNEKTLARVLDGVLQYGQSHSVIVVNDGSTDNTSFILEKYSDRLQVISYAQNQGKGYALRKGFELAIEQGFDNAITIDSDGQHLPDDIPLFVEQAGLHPKALLMGSRNFNQEGIPTKNSFGNKFSNFWFWFDTGQKLPDTQTGFRLYPLAPLRRIQLWTSKFETELEVLVKMAWKDVEIIPLPIRVIYDPNERVTHFRPFRDFTRISILNTWFFILALAWYIPKRFIRAIWRKGVWQTLKEDINRQEESALRKAVSIGWGVFIGIFPIWGFQLLVGISVAVALKLNKSLVFLAANISVPPMIPFIIYGSFKMGAPFFTDAVVFPDEWEQITLDHIHVHMMQYGVGAIVLALIAGGVSFLVSWLIFQFIYKR